MNSLDSEEDVNLNEERKELVVPDNDSDENSEDIDNTKIDSINHHVWTPEQEELLAEWSEKAQCYRWLHCYSERKYSKGHFAFTIPVIILSTLTGTANFGVDSYVPEEHKKMASVIIGGVNILCGIMTTLQNFLRYAENMEAHRNSGILWSKFGRNIRIELALDRQRRKPASDFLKIFRSEYDRLIEQSPIIPEDAIISFKKKFKKKYTDIHRPDICNGLEKCNIYESTEEERVSDIIASASQIMRSNLKTKSILPNSGSPPEICKPNKNIKSKNAAKVVNTQQ